jgi:hypothetical protein
VTGLYTVLALCTVIRRAVLETGGLIPWCQPTCPVCQWQAALFDLGAPSPATALNDGRWRGDPQGASKFRPHLPVRTGEVRRELCAELTPELDGSRGQIHEAGPGWPGQGYMKVTCHDGFVTSCRRDGGDVDL